MRGWRLRRRLAAVYSVLSVVLLLASGVIAWSMVRLDDAIHVRSDVLAPIQVSTVRLVASLVDQETGMRGYLLRGDDSFLEPYEVGRAAETELRASLATRVAGRPDLQRRLDVLQQHIDEWHRDYADPAIAAVRAGGTDASALRDPVLGKERFDAVRLAGTDLDGAVRVAALRARDNVAGAVRALVISLVVAAVALIVLLVLIFRALRVWVTRPLGAVGSDVRRVAGGDLEHVIANTGPPDIEALVSDVELMRLQLLGELGVARSARASIESQAEILRRSNRDLEQFAYVASHDLQEPLRKVASFCQLLERRYGNQLDERGTQYIHFAVDGAKRMQKLINDLLTFSRVGRTTETFVDVDLAEVVQRAETTLSIALENSGGEVVAAELPTVPGDPVLLTQLFQNLIGNAVKFHGEQPPRVRIEAVERDTEWELSCADNGIGIEPEYADKIFVIFQRLHGRDVYEGTGIGLALCRKIVEFHGGRIWLDGTVQSGTTFRWTLPKQRAVALPSDLGLHHGPPAIPAPAQPGARSGSPTAPSKSGGPT
ncbi:histidine kinase [Parafrankia colletiae]|uniref:histidine kinase n=2 Tax=Parafrankia colletiae TaxID=573497 RepID=A0A1S1RJN7_9ACTN|nr:CHASE3 domain-containing protein [Parafrankia colletiae]MCK9899258.1 CHASE3 domain-containing protein [Frankia sp. Cpl3]OHV45999.1 histidine kinase [Parafrankia colletiae]